MKFNIDIGMINSIPLEQALFIDIILNDKKTSFKIISALGISIFIAFINLIKFSLINLKDNFLNELAKFFYE